MPWFDFKVNWTVLELPHCIRLKTMISVIESYMLGWTLGPGRSDAEAHHLEFSLFFFEVSGVGYSIIYQKD